MQKKLWISLIILALTFGMGGCGGNNKVEHQPQNPGTEQQQQQNDTVKSEYLTPIPEGTSLGEFNMTLSEQLMSQKDVLGIQIYEQLDTVYGDITFNPGVDKAYVKQLLQEVLAQLKVNYPNKPIVVQGISDGQVMDSISFQP
mgnify:CR=1 FL=1